MSFLLAEDEVAGTVVDFDKSCALLVQWCQTGRNNQAKRDDDAWPEGAAAESIELAAKAAVDIGLQNKQLGLKPWDGFEATMEATIPRLKTN